MHHGMPRPWRLHKNCLPSKVRDQHSIVPDKNCTQAYQILDQEYNLKENFARPQVENHFYKLMMVTSTSYSYLQLLKIYDNCALQTLYTVMELSTQHHQCLTAFSPFMHLLGQPCFHWCILCFHSEMLTLI